MSKKRIKSKRRYGDYRYMEPYGGLHFALYWFDIDRINLNWNDKELLKKLWEWHGKKIMELWKNEPAIHTGKRPKIWWHVHAKPEDFKILRYEKLEEPREYNPGIFTFQRPIYESQYAYLKRNNLLEPWEIERIKKDRYIAGLEDNSLPFDYSTIHQDNNS